MRILRHADLDTSGLAEQYARTAEAISRSDFRAAQVKKFTGHERLYRAKLSHADRLIFSLVRHGEEVCALMLEIVRNHDYGKSRFLRGAAIDEARIADADVAQARAEARAVRNLREEGPVIHFLDKPLSFDDAQHAIYCMPAPLIIVGGAGSGKTALEKLKGVAGEALYVTQSAYLARHARDLYYAAGFERDDQEVAFLSYRELMESIRVPGGREATWRDFAGWFARVRQAFKGIDARQVFEEIRGVIAAQAGGILSREQYRALGVRQSIFPETERDRLYDLFEKYRAWLAQAKLFDANYGPPTPGAARITQRYASSPEAHGDHQLHTPQSPAGERAEERRPERLGLRRSHRHPESTSRTPSVVTAMAILTATETIRPASIQSLASPSGPLYTLRGKVYIDTATVSVSTSSSSPGNNHWSHWLLHRRRADDPQCEQAAQQSSERYADRILDHARLSRSVAAFAPAAGRAPDYGGSHGDH